VTANPVRHLDSGCRNVDKPGLLHLPSGPLDGALEGRRSADAMADSVTKIRKFLVPLCIPQCRIDEFVSCLAVGFMQRFGCGRERRQGNSVQQAGSGPHVQSAFTATSLKYTVEVLS